MYFCDLIFEFRVLEAEDVDANEGEYGENFDILQNKIS